MGHSARDILALFNPKIDGVQDAAEVERARRFTLHLRILAENNLAVSHARSQAVLDRTSDGVFFADAETGQFIEANPAFCALVGYSREELHARTVDDLRVGPAADQESTREECYRHRDGTEVEVEVSVTEITFREQEVQCVIVRDIRQRKQTEKALR